MSNGDENSEKNQRSNKKVWFEFENRNIWWIIFFSMISGFGFLVSLIYALSVPTGKHHFLSADWGVFSTAIMLSLAFLFVGGILGFLFGIPRTSEAVIPDLSDVAAQQATAQSPTEKSHPKSARELRSDFSELKATREEFSSNANLEQISDWLTKTIVGVSLVEIRTIRDFFYDLSERLGDALGGSGDGSSGDEFAIAIMLFYSICGFLYAYFWTRIFLRELLIASAIRVVKRRREDSLA